MKNLVMGFATNQDEHSVRVFCGSLRKVYTEAECDIVIVTNRHEPYFTELAQQGVKFFGTVNNYSRKTGKLAKSINRVVLQSLRGMARWGVLERLAPEIARAYPVLIETWHHPHFVRWFTYERFLELNQGYGQVFLADVKDVVFQAPLFESTPRASVSLFDQNEQYGKGYWDTMWYRDAWGDAELKKVMGKPALCIGTILGPHAGVLSLVRELTAFFAQHPFGRIEQAVFNYMLLTDRIRTPYEVVPNVSGPVATLANEEAHRAVVARDGAIRRVQDGSVIPAVHMYDRFDNTNALYASS